MVLKEESFQINMSKMSSVDIMKILILFGLLISTFIFGILPVIFIRFIEKASSSHAKSLTEEQNRKKKFANYWRILSFLNCFAAGVFLATCLLELLPSVRHNLIQVMFSENIYTGFPMAEFITVIGLFFILIIEQIALNIKENSPSNEGQVTKRTESDGDVRRPLLAGRMHSTEEEQEEERIASIRNDYYYGGLNDEPQTHHNGSDTNICENNGNITPAPSMNSNILDSSQTRSGSPSSRFVRVHDDNDVKPPNEQNLHVHSVFRSMFLLCALSLHAIFEGLTIGLQEKRSDILSIFGALLVHKCILSFSLGMNLMQSKISVSSAIKSVILFSISAPIGVVIGILIMDLWDSTKSGVVHGILQGFASGTFLYIIFFEILPKEFNSKTDRLLKVLFLIIGYGVITGILFLGDDVKHPLCLINNKGSHP